MYKKYLIYLLLFCSSTAFASGIRRLPPEQLNSKSEFIIFGEVQEIRSDEALDHLTVKVINCIKGVISSPTISVTLQVRGGLKEFDPELKKTDFAVFYLRKSGSGYSSAWGGSIAVFPKHNFESHPSNKSFNR